MEKVIAKREKQSAAERLEREKKTGRRQHDSDELQPVCNRAVFPKTGPLGISWSARAKDDAAVIKSIKPQSQAACVEGLCAGLVLCSINGQSIANLNFMQQIQHLRSASRPMTLCFEAPSSLNIMSQPVARLTRAFSDPGSSPSLLPAPHGDEADVELLERVRTLLLAMSVRC